MKSQQKALVSLRRRYLPIASSCSMPITSSIYTFLRHRVMRFFLNERATAMLHG